MDAQTTKLIFDEPHEGTAFGRNGRIRVKGLHIRRTFDEAETTIEPLTSRLEVGNCRITIPTAELPGIIDALQELLPESDTPVDGSAAVLADALQFWQTALDDEDLEVSGADMVEWFFGTFAPAAEAALADPRDRGGRITCYCPDCGSSAGQPGIVCGVCHRGITEQTHQ